MVAVVAEVADAFAEVMDVQPLADHIHVVAVRWLEDGSYNEAVAASDFGLQVAGIGESYCWKGHSVPLVVAGGHIGFEVWR